MKRTVTNALREFPLDWKKHCSDPDFFRAIETLVFFAYDEGVEAGSDDAYREGYDEGYVEGNAIGYDQGYDDGYRNGVSNGKEAA
jgi:hypothetical protein